MSQISTIREGEILKLNFENLYLIGEIGDGSCFYHSICDALVKTYQNEDLVKELFNKTDVYEARQLYVDNFRLGLSKYLIDMDDISEEEVIKKIKLKNINKLFFLYVRSKKNFLYKNYEKTELINSVEVPWEVYIFHELILKNKSVDKNLNFVVVKETSKKVTEDDILSLKISIKNKTIDMSHVNDYIFEIIDKLKEELDDENKIIFDKKLNNYLLRIYKNINNSPDVLKNEFPNEWMLDYMKDMFNIIKICVIKIKYEFGDIRNYEYGKFLQKDIPNTEEELKQVMLNKNTVDLNGKNFTEKSFNEFMMRDPRLDFNVDKDDILYKLPLNINYLRMMDYTILEKVYIENQQTFHLNTLINRVNSRKDAGWDNIITLIPDILNVNLHILEIYSSKIKVYRSIPELFDNDRVNIILRGDGTHFELVGFLNENGKMQTVFPKNHKIIECIRKDNF